MEKNMRNVWLRLTGHLLLGAAMGFCLAGCNDGTADTLNPSVDVNGAWDVRINGQNAGEMNLQVSRGGSLTGTYLTAQDADAQLSGTMDGYEARFTVIFPAEAYSAALTFSADASAASGVLADERGRGETLRLIARQTAPAPVAAPAQTEPASTGTDFTFY